MGMSKGLSGHYERTWVKFEDLPMVQGFRVKGLMIMYCLGAKDSFSSPILGVRHLKSCRMQPISILMYQESFHNVARVLLQLFQFLLGNC